ncbi:hypothetical protein [Alicyclobacillus dauci]|uniref:Lipoprotein n=1 Tax=Alicyclobacillus dauci TaxID=1475485 RepID=A0ABY6Z4K9_9BACL|nr:hypothetical protein [Alicyclobacillus dauci]WAH37443.1 hypothetical protein NZD86_02570 [Alicyclobacillus dauci]
MGINKRIAMVLFIFASVLLGPSGCAAAQDGPAPIESSVRVSFSSIPVFVQDIAKAIFSSYGSVPDPPQITVTQTWTDSDHKKMYLVSANGSFRNFGTKNTASKLSFSVMDDGTKAWSLTASDNQGKTLWQNNSFSITPINLRFEGQGELWRGTLRIEGVKLNGTSVGSWETDQFNLYYTGSDNPRVSLLYYSVQDSGGGSSGTRENVNLKSGGFGSGGAGNGMIPSSNESPKVTVVWDGHRQVFQLHYSK